MPSEGGGPSRLWTWPPWCVVAGAVVRVRGFVCVCAAAVSMNRAVVVERLAFWWPVRKTGQLRVFAKLKKTEDRTRRDAGSRGCRCGSGRQCGPRRSRGTRRLGRRATTPASTRLDGRRSSEQKTKSERSPAQLLQAHMLITHQPTTGSPHSCACACRRAARAMRAA